MHNVSTIMLTEMETSISRRERPCSCWRQTPPFLQRGEWRPQLYRPWYTLRRCRLYHLDRDVQSLLSLTALSVNGTLIGWRWAAMVTPRLAWNHGRVVNGVNPGSSYALKIGYNGAPFECDQLTVGGQAGTWYSLTNTLYHTLCCDCITGIRE